MREVARIDRMVEKLRQLWHTHPDQRLGQLIEHYVIPSGNLRGSATAYLFYTEDDETEAILDIILEGVDEEPTS